MLKTNINIKPAYDHLVDGSGLERYGRCCAVMELEVIGEKGAITLSCFTNWWTKETLQDCPKICLGHRGVSKTLTSNILYIHAKEELLDDNNYTPISSAEHCEYTQGKCYTYCIDVYLEQELARLIVEEGSKIAFERMVEVYNEVFKVNENIDS